MIKPKIWIVALALPAAVYSVLRHPVEGGLLVDEDEAERLVAAGVLKGDPERARDAGEDDGEEGDGLDDMKVDELNVLVIKEDVPLNDATKKADIIAAIRKHRDEKQG